MSVKDPYGAYKRNEIQGASQGRLIILLYDGAIRFLNQSIVAIEKKDIGAAHENIMRAENIIAELMNSLNMDAGEVAQNLLRLYEFMIWHLIQGNKDKDKDKITEVIGMLGDLRVAWQQIVGGKVDGENAVPPVQNGGETAPKKLNISL
ncbi:flagellar export chaperone FliS [Chrysiogenes arsenatis]|uniref:flagellar export chaperone FliS n=1 Tax=Chrysiogenes arsenatis TaxID=309797 RepID=UPI00040CB45D|nr:flagellar export chaperone FliS [Chrysiogenes arsenatis]